MKRTNYTLKKIDVEVQRQRNQKIFSTLWAVIIHLSELPNHSSHREFHY